VDPRTRTWIVSGTLVLMLVIVVVAAVLD